jgi:RNA polymerase sigma-70 factor, ECF subfamily
MPTRSPTSAASIQDADILSWVKAIAEKQDKSAFAQLYSHYAPRLKGYCQRQGMAAETAEEMAQEAMISVWRRATTFDPAKASVSTWIFTIVRNKRIDLLRRERRPELKAEDFELLSEPEAGADDLMEAQQSARQIAAGLETLSDDQKSVLMMAFYEDKSHSEIAAQTGLPLGTVKSRIRLALSRLKVGLPQ